MLDNSSFCDFVSFLVFLLCYHFLEIFCFTASLICILFEKSPLKCFHCYFFVCVSKMCQLPLGSTIFVVFVYKC